MIIYFHKIVKLHLVKIPHFLCMLEQRVEIQITNSKSIQKLVLIIIHSKINK